MKSCCIVKSLRRKLGENVENLRVYVDSAHGQLKISIATVETIVMVIRQHGYIPAVRPDEGLTFSFPVL